MTKGFAQYLKKLEDITMSGLTMNDWKELLSFKNDDEKFELYAELISLKIARQINEILDQKGITRSELAKMINTSPSYITQIMKGDKLINLKLIAKIEYYLDATFNFTFKSNFHQYDRASSSSYMLLNTNNSADLITEVNDNDQISAA